MQAKHKPVSDCALDLDKNIANRFNRLLWRISNFGERDDLEKYDISLAQWRIMAQLGKLGRMPIGKLSTISGVGQTVGSRIVKSLKIKGCVETRKSTLDNRQQLVQLSHYGFTVHDAIAPGRKKAHDQVQQGLSDDELSTMLALCNKLEQHLDLLNDTEDDGW